MNEDNEPKEEAKRRKAEWGEIENQAMVGHIKHQCGYLWFVTLWFIHVIKILYCRWTVKQAYKAAWNTSGHYRACYFQQRNIQFVPVTMLGDQSKQCKARTDVRRCWLKRIWTQLMGSLQFKVCGYKKENGKQTGREVHWGSQDAFQVWPSD